jgi:hypothetical protein
MGRKLVSHITLPMNRSTGILPGSIFDLLDALENHSSAFFILHSSLFIPRLTPML